MKLEELVYGKDKRERIVSIEVEDETAIVYKENQKGVVTEVIENWFYAFFDRPMDDNCVKLQGDLHYGYAKRYRTKEEMRQDVNIAKYQKKIDTYKITNPKESLMIRQGLTYYKGLKPSDVSVLSFDIEATSLKPSDSDLILLISNTFRNSRGEIERKLFSYDDFKSTKEMVYAWCHWVREKDPSVICGHNIFNYDFPYINFYVNKLPLGRNEGLAYTADYTSEFRKEAGQTYSYHNVLIPGREVIDTMHLSYKYDAATRKYGSYGLKKIIEQEGLEKEGRQHYDASTIRVNYKIPKEWEKIKKYAEDDGDDALALFDLMIPSYFYYCQAVPKTLQQIINGNSGSQVNSWMLRAYIQSGHSIPKASDAVEYIGAISFGNPGVYKNLKKVDVASLYPSIMRQYKVYDKSKDPMGYFLKMVEFFTEERLKNKQLGKETGDRFYKDLEQSQKIFINSAYGFLGAGGLHFNSPEKAAFITKTGRDILEKGIKWAESKGFAIANADTDSFSYTGGDDFEAEIEELNALYPDMIRWEDDGVYDSVLVVKAKNYALRSGGKTKIKGSGLKASMKESALRDFMNQTIQNLLDGNYSKVLDSYIAICHNCISITDITPWAFKKTVTKSVLQPKRTNEQRVLDALKGKNIQEGDKVYLFYKSETELACVEDFNGEYDTIRLLGKIYKTLKIFETVLDLKQFPKYYTKKGYAMLTQPCLQVAKPK